MVSSVQPVMLGRDEGSHVDMGRLERIVLKMSGPETGCALDLLEITTQPGGGPPEHVHHRNDETFYVLEGAQTPAP